MTKQTGFSLSEIMISLFLASLVMGVLTQCYLNSKHQYVEAEKILTARFDLQWVSDMLADSIRRSGFTPCLSVDQLHVVDRRNASYRISGLIIENKPKQRIEVNRMSEFFSPITTILNPTQIIVSSAVELNPKHPILIADCVHAEVHQILTINKLPRAYLITLKQPLMFSYPEVTYCGEWLEEKWYIKQNTRGVDALYYQSTQTEELTSLIHSLSINEQPIHEKRLLEISLGLDQDKAQKLVVAVRGS